MTWDQGSETRDCKSVSVDAEIEISGDLDAVADELNDRPRKRLRFAKPSEEIGPLLLR